MPFCEPVVCADATALPETEGGAAALFPVDDVEALAATLRVVLAHPAIWTARSRARAAEFSWERTARATWDVYAELL